MPRANSIRAIGLKKHLGDERYKVFVRMVETDVSDASAARYFEVKPSIIRKWKLIYELEKLESR